MRVSLPLEVVRTIRLSTWRALFAARGAPPGLDVDTCDLAAIAAAIACLDLPDALARAVFLIAVFATEAGRTDIYAAADIFSYGDGWPDAISPADLIASLIAEADVDLEAALVLDAAKTLRDRVFRTYASYFFAGVSNVSPSIGDPASYDQPFRAHFGRWGVRHGFGAVLLVGTRTIDGVHAFEIVHEDRMTTMLVGPELTPVTQRGTRSHLVVYEPELRTLVITTNCPELVVPLARIAGLALFGDARHFLHKAAIGLSTVQERGRAALVAAGWAQNLDMTAVGGNVDTGKQTAFTVRHGDFFKAIEDYKIDIEGGALGDMTFRAPLDARGGGPESTDIAVRPPHHCTVSEGEATARVHAQMRRVRIMSPGERLLDFYGLKPWVEAALVWIASEGKKGFAALVEEGTLVADTTNRSVASPAHPYAGRIAVAYPIKVPAHLARANPQAAREWATKMLAVSKDPSIAPFLVDVKDLVVYALDLGKLAALIARQMGLEGPATKPDEDGVLLCGRKKLESAAEVVVYLPTRAIRASTMKRLRAEALPAHVVLMVPKARMKEGGLLEVAMAKLAGPWRPVLGAIVRALKIDDVVDATIYAPEDARVVVHKATGRVWVDGVRCDGMSEACVRLVVILIERGGAVHTKEIAEYIAAGGKVTRDLTRRAVRQFLECVKRNMLRKRKKKDVPAWIGKMIGMPRTRYYRLRVKGAVE